MSSCPHIFTSDEGTSHCELAEADARAATLYQEGVDDLRDRLAHAAAELREDHHARVRAQRSDRRRLDKATGVDLALSYLDDLRRELAEVDPGAAVRPRTDRPGA